MKRKMTQTESVLAEGITHVLVFDVETSGQNPRFFDLVEIAATIWELGAKEPTCELHFFFGLNKRWCVRTMEEFWNNPEKGVDGKTPMKAMRDRLCAEKTPVASEGEAAMRLTTWARDAYRVFGGKIMVVTDTPGFDYQFITHLLACIQELPGGTNEQPPSSLNYLFGKYQPVCDINSFYKGVGGSLQKHGARDKMIAKFDIEYPEWVTQHEHNHDPRSDARSIAAKLSFLFCREDEE